MLDHARLLSRFKVWQRMIPELAVSKLNLIKLMVLLAISVFLISCETIGYYGQATRGQLANHIGREDIQEQLEHELKSYSKKKPWRENKGDDAESKEKPKIDRSKLKTL